MTLTHYVVASGADIDELESEVNDLIQNGYLPTGSFFATETAEVPGDATMFYQPMLRSVENMVFNQDVHEPSRKSV